MQYTAYYIIRPRPALEEVLGGTEDLAHLLEPELWTHPQGGRTTLTAEDHISRVKRLFVAYMLYLVIPSTGTPPELDLAVDEASFDRWWALEVFDGEDYSTESAAEALRTLDRPELADLLGLFPPFPPYDPSLHGEVLHS